MMRSIVLLDGDVDGGQGFGRLRGFPERGVVAFFWQLVQTR